MGSLRLPAWLIRAGLLILALGLLVSTAGWRMAESRVYDLLSRLVPPPARAADGIALVGIDEPSFADLGLRWPWPRDLHAALLSRLHAVGARAVAFDIVFAESGQPAEDAALATAIAADGPVILATDEANIETPQASQHVRIEPLPELIAAGALTGTARVELDADGVVRRLPPAPDSFARAVLGASGDVAGASAATPPGALMRFFPPDRDFTRVSYYQALDPEKMLPKGLLQDRVVFVGLAVASTPDPRTHPPDTFLTPLTLTDGRLAVGAEIQATAFANLRGNLWIAALPLPARLAVMAIAVLATGLWLRHWTPLRAGMAIVVGGSAACAGSLALLAQQPGIWLPPLGPAAGVTLAAIVEGAAAYLSERKARQFIRAAFSRYLAPELVDSLARDPGRLRLGGERRQMTFLFCDIRGFTQLSERLQSQPERLTQLVNRFLSVATHVIREQGGTVDKYIGDCVMAFWNAPLDDPDHALHACRCALALLEAVEAMSSAVAREQPDLPPLHVGIGVNTGGAVVGNIGSDVRFAYSALGDAVNLASRLEGLTKTYGLPIVVGEATVAACPVPMAFLELDRLAVRGKLEPVTLYALLGDDLKAAGDGFAELRASQAAWLEAWRQKDVGGMRSSLTARREQHPSLAVLWSLYAERLVALEEAPGPDGRP